MAAVQPRRVITAIEPPPAAGGGRRVVIALGKAGPGLAAAWLERHPGWADRLLVVTPHGVPVPPGLPRDVVLRGGHPVPDADGAAAAGAIHRLVASLGRSDMVLVLLSGGASAMLARPIEGVALATVQAVTRQLLNAGAPIAALNAVRRHLLVLAGGGLARLAAPATVFTAVLSDVLSDRLCDVGSGPTVAPREGPQDARAVLVRWRVVAPEADRALRRLSPPAPIAAGAAPVVLASNRTAVEAARASLERAGVRVVSGGPPVSGDAAAYGRVVGAMCRALDGSVPSAVVLGAETTVTVRGDGKGGRSQELALAAAGEIAGYRGRVVLAAGTDGVDGASEHAGAIVDGTTVARCRAAGSAPAAALATNDSATALVAAGDALVTGPTGTNVCDLIIALAADAKR